jgi:hypothetical protein
MEGWLIWGNRTLDIRSEWVRLGFRTWEMRHRESWVCGGGYGGREVELERKEREGTWWLGVNATDGGRLAESPCGAFSQITLETYVSADGGIPGSQDPEPS